MTTTVTVKVGGRYRATVKQDEREPVVITGESAGGAGQGHFSLPHPANSLFQISEEYVPEKPKAE